MIDPDLDTFGKILTAMLAEVKLDVTTGKATKVWDKKELREHLRVDSSTFSTWMTGRCVPPAGTLRTVIGVVEEAGTAGLPYIEALYRIFNRVCQEEVEPRVRYSSKGRVKKHTLK